MGKLHSLRVTVNVRVEPDDGRRPLRFTQGNAKLHAAVTVFSLPAGWSCPFAKGCKARADRRTGHIRDGRNSAFRCYAASMEARRPSVRRSRWHNLEQLKRCESRDEVARLILDSLSPFARLVRVHDSGDFYSRDYFDAWLEAARQRPATVFYFYTKALPLWVARLAEVGTGHEPGAVPNFVPTASRGGTHDGLIAAHGLRSAAVVFSPEEAEAAGLGIDHDDSHAMAHGPDFALLLHGTQPAGSAAAAARQQLSAGGWTGYGRRTPLAVIG